MQLQNIVPPTFIKLCFTFFALLSNLLFRSRDKSSARILLSNRVRKDYFVSSQLAMKRGFENVSTNESKYSELSPPPLPAGLSSAINMKRVRVLSNEIAAAVPGDCVVYWMSREQRVNDNYSLLYSRELARQKSVPLRVVFNIVPTYLGATIRQYAFMIQGLKEVETQLRELNIPFHLESGDPIENLPRFLVAHRACALVSDFSPLRTIRHWMTSIASILDARRHNSSSSSHAAIPFYMVDARNIVPCWFASDKLEYSARTIRSKVKVTDVNYPFESHHRIDVTYTYLHYVCTCDRSKRRFQNF